MITLHDLSGREKAGSLPSELAHGQGQSSYRSGQLGYWSASHDLAIYYHNDAFLIPSPGIVMIGEIESGLDAIRDASDNAQLTTPPKTIDPRTARLPGFSSKRLIRPPSAITHTVQLVG
jgi:hypothetical protein